MKEIKHLAKELRTVTAEVMEQIMKFAPRDGFKLESELLNQEYTVTGVTISEFDGRPSVFVDLENQNNSISLSLAAIKKSRSLSSDVDTSSLVKFNGNDHIFLRDSAKEIWSNSKYTHSVAGMNQEEDFIIPEKIFIAAAVIAQNRDDEKPKYNSFLYNGFNTVVAVYNKKDAFPTMDAFKEELMKTGEDRISGLPSFSGDDLNILLPSYVKGEPSDFVSTLILKDIVAATE